MRARVVPAGPPVTRDWAIKNIRGAEGASGIEQGVQRYMHLSPAATSALAPRGFGETACSWRKRPAKRQIGERE